MDALIDAYDDEQLKKELPEFDIGDTVRVSTRIVEGKRTCPGVSRYGDCAQRTWPF